MTAEPDDLETDECDSNIIKTFQFEDPLLPALILTHILQNVTLKDEHTRRDGS